MTKAAVVGLGTMGPGIAQTLLRAGMEVTAFDLSEDQRKKASAGLALANSVLTNLGTPDRSNGRSVTIADSLKECVTGASLVVETVPEKFEIKAQAFKEIDALVDKKCVIGSNTSGIPISKLQAGVSAPERVVGMHWSNPPHIIPMIEVIAGDKTSKETVDWMVNKIKELGLLPVVVQKDVPGFVENRVLYALLRECVDLVDQGVIDAEGLDTCVSWGIGYKLSVIGPMALLDVAGLDIYQAVGSYLNKELCNRDTLSPFVTDRTAAGKLGIKSGGGIFSYTPEKITALQQQRAKRLVAVRKALES
jgi:5-formyl-3-hydroxy-2-methylpyridine 4-carboxylate dehydrogenase